MAAPAFGQSWLPSEFAAPVTLSGAGSNGAVAVRAADLDGDGDRDLVVASQADLRWVWYEALGGGAFGPARLLCDTLRIATFEVADLDGDGDPDLVGSAVPTATPAAPTQAGVFWLEGLGGGAFRNVPRLALAATNGDVRAFGLLDVEGDGDLDLAAVRYFSGEVVLARRVGAGFTAPVVVGTVIAFGPFGLRAGDLDGDGRPDLVVSSQDNIQPVGTVNTFRNLGGTFGAPTSLGFAALAEGLALIDHDGDGDLDVLAGRSNGVALHTNVGGGTFAPPVVVAAGMSPARIEARDVDGDLDQDLVLATSPSSLGNVVLLRRTGPAAFAPAATLASELGAFTLSDLDGDGDVDLAGGHPNRAGWRWLANDGLGTFGPETVVGTPALDAPGDVLAADLDGDGDLDAVACGDVSGAVLWFENVGGAFGPAQPVGTSGGTPNFHARLDAGDVDGDGDVDVVVTRTRAEWFPRQGGGFGAPVLLAADAHDAALGDLDGDGDLDVALGSSAGLAWRRNLGAGVFGAAASVDTTYLHARGDVALADLDGDGRLDLLATGNVLEALVVVPNLGGTFGAAVLFDVPFSLTPLVRVGAGDLDGDGRPELLGSGPAAFWFRNLGGFAFEAWRWAGFFGSPGAGFAPADVDGDGDLDFLHTYDNTDGTVVLWRENDGTGELTAEHLVTDRALLPFGLAAGDFDQDGDPDVLVASYSDDLVLALENGANRIGYACSPAVPNSTGQPGRILVYGSFTAQDNRLTLIADRLPVQTVGYFLTSRLQGFQPNPGGSRGNLCLVGAIGRYTGPGQVRTTGSFDGSFALALDLTVMPTPTGAVPALVGQVWHFQAWHRDTFQGAATSNFTDTVGVWFE